MPLNAGTRYLSRPEREDVYACLDALRALCKEKGHTLYLKGQDHVGNPIYGIKEVPTFRAMLRKEMWDV